MAFEECGKNIFDGNTARDRLEEQDPGSKDLLQRFDSRLADAAAAAQVGSPRTSPSDSHPAQVACHSKRWTTLHPEAPSGAVLV